jgi:hypothetical protein
MRLHGEPDADAFCRAHRLMVTAVTDVTPLAGGAWRAMSWYGAVNVTPSWERDGRGSGTRYPQPLLLANARGVPVDPARLAPGTLLVLLEPPARERPWQLVGTAEGPDSVGWFEGRPELWWDGPAA